MAERRDKALVRRADALADKLCEAVDACRTAGLDVYVTMEGGDEPRENDGEWSLGIWITARREIKP